MPRPHKPRRVRRCPRDVFQAAGILWDGWKK